MYCFMHLGNQALDKYYCKMNKKIVFNLEREKPQETLRDDQEIINPQPLGQCLAKSPWITYRKDRSGNPSCIVTKK